ncbi:glycosyltransferase [Microvirga sp. M2]|uniref:glycosyltransferase n=1 Tax=Microvirga sp. M2 TaxID=3073270 RepID=UPI0039C45303
MKQSAAPGSEYIAVVVPCYRSAKTIGLLVERLSRVLTERGSRYQIVLIDDASPDNTWEVLLALHMKYGTLVKCIRLARNVGQHMALQCGLGSIDTDITHVVTMDDDLQHRPEDLQPLLDALQDADIAIASYGKKQHAKWRNLSGGLIDRLLRHLFKLPNDFQLTSFRAFRVFVAHEVVENQTEYTYITAAILAVSTRVVNVDVKHAAREDGTSGYSLTKSLVLAANLLMTYSRIPFIIVAATCLTSFVFTFLVMAVIFIMHFLTVESVPGWTSLMIMTGVQSTMIMAAIAIVLIYVSRTHKVLNGARASYRIADVR